ncbi:MAG: hypothetical protein K6T65_10645, partial [Peptococcaceae bacterium]|nr:hypothetical protein [Peptococcaceae bacterium]
AWLLAEYFKSHARRVYQHLQEDPEDRKIRQVADWIKKHAPAGVTARELTMARLFKNVDEAKALIRVMERRGLGYFSEEGGSRGPKRQIFILK